MLQLQSYTFFFFFNSYSNVHRHNFCKVLKWINACTSLAKCLKKIRANVLSKDALILNVSADTDCRLFLLLMMSADSETDSLVVLPLILSSK